MFFTLATTLIAALSVSAQTTHTITVGAGGNLTYTPSNITAAAKDIVTFVFTTKNHTVTQSTFAEPCTQLTNTSVTPNIVGISSGFVPINGTPAEFPTWSFTVTDTSPLWFFCLQANHCQQGMVFSINATPQKSYDAFLTAAKASNASVPNPQTGGAASPPAASGTDITNPTASSTPAGSATGGSASAGAPSSTQTGAAPSQTTGAAVSNNVPSLAMGALALVLGISL